MLLRRCAVGALGLVFALLPGLAAAFPLYAVADLGTLGGTFSLGAGINATGAVVGYASTPANARFDAFLFTTGPLTDLGTLGGTSSRANAINATGQIVGEAMTAANQEHAFFRDPVAGTLV